MYQPHSTQISVSCRYKAIKRVYEVKVEFVLMNLSQFTVKPFNHFQFIKVDSVLYMYASIYSAAIHSLCIIIENTSAADAFFFCSKCGHVFGGLL